MAVNTWGQKNTIRKVVDGEPIYKGYKISRNKLYFVSSDLLASVRGDITAINYLNEKQAGLTVAPIEIVQPIQIPAASPITMRTIVYTVE